MPIKRLERPEDVANAIVYLASKESIFITRIILVFDGGMLAQWNLKNKEIIMAYNVALVCAMLKYILNIYLLICSNSKPIYLALNIN